MNEKNEEVRIIDESGSVEETVDVIELLLLEDLFKKQGLPKNSAKMAFNNYPIFFQETSNDLKRAIGALTSALKQLREIECP